MKQFGTILSFELLGYLKNKIFVGITIFLVVAISILMFIPNIISALGADEDASLPPSQMPVMLVHSDDAAFEETVKRCFAEIFIDYNVKCAEGTADEVRAAVERGDAECAFALDSEISYTYYVNNLSLYDMNAAAADETLLELYRMRAMLGGGLSEEKTVEIMSTVIDSRTETLGKDQAQNFLYTYIMIMALYMVILLYGQMVATSVATEKSSRAMELLITSASPVNMMFGKILAACIAGFMQLVAIFGTSILLFNLNRDAWSDNYMIQSIFNIPVDLLIYMLVFFVLGFLIYAFMYGAVGSTASKLEDINTSVMPITFLFIIALLVVVFSMTSASIDNVAMMICSYLPFTSPIAMFTRIAMSEVAWYEIAISISVLAASTVGVGVLSARIYRVGVLLYGTKPKLGEIMKSIFTK